MNIRRRRKHLAHLATLIAGLNSLLAGRVAAQTFSTLHSFAADTDGAYPTAGLILSGNALYGAAPRGGGSDNGAVFSVQTDGTGFTNLHSFSGVNDGAGPNTLVLSSNALYGTASAGGGSNCGTVFALNIVGTAFRNLHSFLGGQDGFYPSAGLTISGNTLYGTTQYGGSSNYNGTIFALNIDGTGFTNLHAFNGMYGGGPAAEMVLSGNTLYGTTLYGGNGSGTLFTINTDGLHDLVFLFPIGELAQSSLYSSGL